MAYLKKDSTASQREASLRQACLIIADKMRDEQSQVKQSYVIESTSDYSTELNSPFNKPFGRG